MRFKTLSNTTDQEILAMFNLAFSDYSISLKLTLEQLQSKFKSEHIHPDYSILAYENEQLLGFIFHGVVSSQTIKLYNGGTGVIPTARGNGLTVKMYEWLFDQPKAKQIDTIQLEVIADNTPAISSYLKVGFTDVRKLNCYRGNLAQNAVSSLSEGIHIKQVDKLDWNQVESFWDCKPSYQNTKQCIEANLDQHKIYISTSNQQTIGYLIINPIQARIKQIAVDPKFRRMKVGQALLQYAGKDMNKSLSIINVDDSSSSTNDFLIKHGLMPFLTQNEMLLQR